MGAKFFFILGLLLPIMGTSSTQHLESEGCVVAGKTYSVGESFSPTVNTAEGNYTAVCYNCTCYNVVPLCEETHCPPLDCENPIRVDGQCCTVCMQPDISVGHSQCIYNGILIEHEQEFHPDNLDSEDDQADNKTYLHCTECTCFDGDITCKNLSSECPALECDLEVAVVPEGSCCPVCPALPTEEPEKPQDCLSSDGRYFANGESWNPLFPMVGPIPCINCTCIDSREVCVTLPCPTGPLPPCKSDEPVPDIVLCCATCVIVPDSSSSLPEQATPPASIPTLIVPDLVADTPPPTIPCSPSHTVRVWRHLSTDTVAMEIPEDTPLVRIFRWTEGSEGGYVMEEVELSPEEFDSTAYESQGWTSTRRVNGLDRDSRKSRIESCTSNCASLVIKFLRATACVES